MPRYDKPHSPSVETQEAAERLARAQQKPGQTKEQTRLISQGIQQGIAEYKRQQKAKARELNKLKKKTGPSQVRTGEQTDSADDHGPTPRHEGLRPVWLPWSLLILSWLLFAVHIWMGH